jgi:hypothetical protein
LIKELTKYGSLLAIIFGALSLITYYVGNSLNNETISGFVGIWVVFIVLAVAAAGSGAFLKPN